MKPSSEQNTISLVDAPMSPLSAAVRFAPIVRSTHGAGVAGVAGGAVGVAGGVGHGLSPEAEATAWEYDASTCVICMDRMESHVLTTVCNHSFHVECLVKWQDSPCPVCRFHHNNASEASTCQVTYIYIYIYVSISCGMFEFAVIFCYCCFDLFFVLAVLL